MDLFRRTLVIESRSGAALRQRESRGKSGPSARLYDPDTYTSPWKIAMPINRDPSYQMFEYACHEGNYGLPNTLKGARAEEKATR